MLQVELLHGVVPSPSRAVLILGFPPEGYLTAKTKNVHRIATRTTFHDKTRKQNQMFIHVRGCSEAFYLSA